MTVGRDVGLSTDRVPFGLWKIRTNRSVARHENRCMCRSSCSVDLRDPGLQDPFFVRLEEDDVT